MTPECAYDSAMSESAVFMNLVSSDPGSPSRESPSQESPGEPRTSGDAAESSALASTLDDLTRITQMEDGTLRNLLITQRYCDLSAAMSTPLGQTNANWSTFACWASKTAGESIRSEEIPRPVLNFLQFDADFDKAFRALMKKLTGRTANISGSIDIFDDARNITHEVSSQIAAGNLKVFAELTPVFARFCAAASSASTADELSGNICRHLTPGPTADGGQDDLARAFRAYAEASFEHDSERKAELIFFANCLVGLHEQTRLQANIQGAIDAPVNVLLARHGSEEAASSAPRSGHHLMHDWIASLLEPLRYTIAKAWDRFATETVMNLALPGGRHIGLGHDIPRGADHAMFPDDLRTIDSAELRRFLQIYDRSANTTAGSGARDWVSLGDRMNFIVDLFRSRQQTTNMWNQPFRTEQQAEFEHGRMPGGEL